MVRIAALIALLALTAGCAGSDDDGQSANTDPEACSDLSGRSLVLGLASEIDFSKIHVLKAVEDLREQGIDVEVKTFEGSPDAFRALVAGELDVFDGSSLGSLIQFTEQVGDEVKYIVGAQTSTDYILVSGPDITTFDDLKGGTIGISAPGDISDTLTRYVLQQQGIDPADFEFLQIGGTGARMAGLVANQIDAGAAHAADGLNAIESGDLNNLLNYGDSIDSYIGLGGGATTKWLDANPCLAQAYVDARVNANRWAAANKDEFIARSQEYVSASELSDSARSKAYDIYSDIGLFPVNGGLSSELLTGTIEIEQAAGQVGEDAPDPTIWADPSYADDYLEREGTVDE